LKSIGTFRVRTLLKAAAWSTRDSIEGFLLLHTLLLGWKRRCIFVAFGVTVNPAVGK
jgi:hypothetical protein